MTTIRSLPILIMLLCGVALGTAVTANTAAADQADHAAAYKQNLKLAKGGDAFAQYQVSYMELMGLGTKPDVVEAMAWAVLAAESGHEDLLRYQDAVATLVPEKQRGKAQSKADYYLRRWGPDDRAGKSARAPDQVCTGSRLGGNCGEEGSSAGKWIAWDEDRSDDPAQKGQVEELNRSIQENATEIRNHSGDS